MEPISEAWFWRPRTLARPRGRLFCFPRGWPAPMHLFISGRRAPQILDSFTLLRAYRHVAEAPLEIPLTVSG